MTFSDLRGKGTAPNVVRSHCERLIQAAALTARKHHRWSRASRPRNLGLCGWLGQLGAGTMQGDPE